MKWNHIFKHKNGYLTLHWVTYAYYFRKPKLMQIKKCFQVFIAMKLAIIRIIAEAVFHKVSHNDHC